MAISYIAAGSPVATDSIAIPVANLAGFTVFNQFDGVNPNQALSRVIQGFLEKSLSVFTDSENNGNNPISLLGLSLTKDLDDPVGATEKVMISVWSITFQRLIKLTGSVNPLPVPTDGTNLGDGDFSLTDMFPGVEKVANTANVTANSIVFDIADLMPYGSQLYPDINLAVGQDNRALWIAIVSYLIEQVSLRAAGTQSAIVAKAINAPTTPALPATLTATTNPTSAINSSDLFGKAHVTQQTYQVSVELQIDGLTNTIDVNFV